MRKICLVIAVLVLLFATYMVMSNGVKIGGFQISSVKQLSSQKTQLENMIANTKEKINITFPQSRAELDEKQTILLENKNQYVQLANLSSDSEIAKANVNQTYSLEYLWVKVGNYATAEGITLKLEVTSNNEGSRNLNFTAQGAYLGIIRFISSIENDEDLNFRIQDFELVSTGINKDKTAKLKATFAVKYLNINMDKIIQNSTTNTNETDNGTPTDTDVQQMMEKAREQQNLISQIHSQAVIN